MREPGPVSLWLVLGFYVVVVFRFLWTILDR